MWYVIQTLSTKEPTVKEFIEHRVPKELYEDCRIVYYETEKKYQGSWHKEKKRMFPGYLFVITDDPDAIKPHLRQCPEMSRILGIDGKPVPLLPHEELFLKTLTNDGDTVDMSIGVKVGDRIIVNDGFLRGRESCIRKIDRHKRKAWIEVDLLGEIRLAEVGLEVIAKKEAEESNASEGE